MRRAPRCVSAEPIRCTNKSVNRTLMDNKWSRSAYLAGRHKAFVRCQSDPLKLIDKSWERAETVAQHASTACDWRAHESCKVCSWRIGGSARGGDHLESAAREGTASKEPAARVPGRSILATAFAPRPGDGETLGHWRGRRNLYRFAGSHLHGEPRESSWFDRARGRDRGRRAAGRRIQSSGRRGERVGRCERRPDWPSRLFRRHPGQRLDSRQRRWHRPEIHPRRPFADADWHPWTL